LIGKADVRDLARQIESEVFSLCGSQISDDYKAKCRSLLFNLRDAKNPLLRLRVLRGELPPEQLCRLSAEELASPELAELRKQIELKSVESVVLLPENEVNQPSSSIKLLAESSDEEDEEDEDQDLDEDDKEGSGGERKKKKRKTTRKGKGKTIGIDDMLTSDDETFERLGRNGKREEIKGGEGSRTRSPSPSSTSSPPRSSISSSSSSSFKPSSPQPVSSSSSSSSSSSAMKEESLMTNSHKSAASTRAPSSSSSSSSKFSPDTSKPLSPLYSPSSPSTFPPPSSRGRTFDKGPVIWRGSIEKSFGISEFRSKGYHLGGWNISELLEPEYDCPPPASLSVLGRMDIRALFSYLKKLDFSNSSTRSLMLLEPDTGKCHYSPLVLVLLFFSPLLFLSLSLLSSFKPLLLSCFLFLVSSSSSSFSSVSTCHS
jgi:hypothetical protein